jgi:hypothetical protein
MIAESDPIFIPDISRWIFFVTLDYELMNPILIRWKYIWDTESRPFNVSISHRPSERLYCQYLEKRREIANEKLVIYVKSWVNTDNNYDNDVGPS